jgi:lipid A 4'-phosphatase
MNRASFAVALAIAALFGVGLGVYPELDLTIASRFYDPATQTFIAAHWSWVGPTRDATTYLIALLVAPAILSIVGKMLMPRWRMPMPSRAAVFLSITLALGPFFLTNIVLKNHWARMRPVDIVQFGGIEQFTPWWDPRGPCSENCSFIAGEPAGAIWTLALASLAPPPWRPLAYVTALLFWVGVGFLRIAKGGHFFSDVVFAGLFMFFVVWTLHGLIYRWRPTQLTDEMVTRRLEQMGQALRDGLATLRPSGAGK